MATYHYGTMKNRPRVGLALSGGSALGISHIGALQSLADHHVPIDCIAGTSAGSMVAALYAFGMAPDEMAKTAKKLNWFTFFKFSYSTLGLVTNQAVGDMFIKLVGDVNIEDAAIPLAIVATDLTSGEKVVFRKGNAAHAIMASTCVPGLFVPVKSGSTLLVDGGLVENLPLSPLEEMGAQVKIGVDLERYRAYKAPRHLVDVMMNSVDIVTHAQSKYRASPADVRIEPHLEAYTTSDWGRAAELLAEGYRTATNAIPDIMQRLEQRAAVNHREHAVPLTWLGRFWRWLQS